MKGLVEIQRVFKPGGRLLIADMTRPSPSHSKRLLTSLVFHHGHHMQFGIEDIPELLDKTGFEHIQKLDDHFPIIGFVRAIKPNT